MNEWDQLPNEPAKAYTRFLFFVSFGPTRNLLRVYRSFLREKVKKSQKKTSTEKELENLYVSNTWRKEHDTYHWEHRALSWDKFHLLTKGEQIVIDYIEILRLFTRKILLTLMDDEIRPDDFESIIDSIRLLSTFISAEAIATVASSGSGGTANDSHAADNAREPIHQLPA